MKEEITKSKLRPQTTRVTNIVVVSPTFVTFKERKIQVT